MTDDERSIVIDVLFWLMVEPCLPGHMRSAALSQVESFADRLSHELRDPMWLVAYTNRLNISNVRSLRGSVERLRRQLDLRDKIKVVEGEAASAVESVTAFEPTFSAHVDVPTPAVVIDRPNTQKGIDTWLVEWDRDRNRIAAAGVL
jgi:hypothetical protein